jgi:phage terminase large subunit GpA-like protein
MDAFSDDRNRRVVVMSSAQVGKTTIVENVIGFHIDQDPSPILVLQPTLDMAETFSKDRLSPMLRDTASLKGKVADARSRDSLNTLLHKRYQGGHVTMAGANSPSSLASRPIRVFLGDEINRYPVSAGTEGDPVRLAIKRTNNFWNRRIGLFSTPTDEDVGIHAEFLQSDQRYFFVACPDCEHEQRLTWAQVKWTKPDDAKYACESCGSLWDEGMRDAAVSRGTWKATAEFNGVAGFHINELYSPWRSFSDVVVEFLEAKDEPEKLRVWVNTSLGEPWKQETSGVSAQALEDEEGLPVGVLHEGVLALTLGVDTQGDRLSLQLVGWGRNSEQWTIENIELAGDPHLEESWERLTEYRRQEFDHPLGGKLRVSITAIDSGGLHTQRVVAYAREFRGEGVIAVKGSSTPLPTMMKTRPTKVDYKSNGKVYRKSGEVWLVGTDVAKSAINSKLRVDSDRRRIHFASGLGSDFFRQLTAETYDKRKRRWVNVKKRRNEALDTLVYATAATLHPWLRLDVATDAKWKALESKVTRAEEERPPPTDVAKPITKPAASRFFSPRGRGFVKGW